MWQTSALFSFTSFILLGFILNFLGFPTPFFFFNLNIWYLLVFYFFNIYFSSVLRVLLFTATARITSVWKHHLPENADMFQYLQKPPYIPNSIQKVWYHSNQASQDAQLTNYFNGQSKYPILQYNSRKVFGNRLCLGLRLSLGGPHLNKRRKMLYCYFHTYWEFFTISQPVQ